ncbi:hypothetical protein GW17_00043061, partial [Ensete ventricosum]
RCRTIGCRSRVRSEPGHRSDFVTGLTSESRKLRRLRRPSAVAALPQAVPPSLGLLVTPFTGVPPGEPIVPSTPPKHPATPAKPGSSIYDGKRSVCPHRPRAPWRSETQAVLFPDRPGAADPLSTLHVVRISCRHHRTETASELNPAMPVREGDGIVHRKGSHNDPCCSHSSSSVASVVQAGGLRSRASASSAHNLGESRPSSSFPSRSSPADMPALAVVLHRSLAAASSAADRMSLGSELLGRGSCSADSGKLSCASQPLSRSAATSCATAAISADSKLPSQILVFFPGSRISDTHFPHFLFLTPRYCTAKSPLISASCSIADLRTELLSFLTR